MNDTTAATPAVHVCLVSKELLPNLIPALMLKPKTVHLVTSSEMQSGGQRLESMLRSGGIEVVTHHNAPIAPVASVRAYAETLAASLRSEQNVVLNVTGGTKLMALTFAEAFRPLAGMNMIYTDTDHNVIEVLHPSGQDVVPLRSLLTIDRYLAAQGMRLGHCGSNEPGCRTRGTRLRPMTAMLARYAALTTKTGGLLNDLNRLVDKALDDRGHRLMHPDQILDRHLSMEEREVLKALAEHQILVWDNAHSIHFNSEADARYIRGGWLEETAWHVLADLKPQACAVPRYTATGLPSLPGVLGLGAIFAARPSGRPPSAALRRGIATMALRHDASPASPVEACLPRTTRRRFAFRGAQRRNCS